MDDDMRKIWNLIERDVKRIDRERAKHARKSRRELLNEILAAEEKTNKACRVYMSMYNIMHIPPTLRPEKVIRFSLFERLLLKLGLAKMKKIVEILEALERHYYRAQREGKDAGEIILLLSDIKSCIKYLR